MPKKRLKVARAIEPNHGNTKAAARRIKRLINAFENEFKREALKIAAPFCHEDMAMDADPKLTQEQMRALRLITKLKGKMLIKLGVFPRKVSKWYCKELLREITASQKRALTKAGVSNAWLKQKWTVPVTKGQYIAPGAAKKIPAFVDWSTGLITRMCEQSAQKVQNAIADGLSKGYSLSRLTQRIRGLENMDDARASRVALDQSCKLNQFIQIENAKAIGVKEGVWVHVPGQYESRRTHIHMNGKRFVLSEGMYDPELERNVFPAELPFCRCCFRAVLPGFITD